MVKRDNFASKFGVFVALAGSAVGLGNLWRFPYLIGNSGGASFIILYLAFVFLLALPIFIAEFIIGRRSQLNVFGAFDKLSNGSAWKYSGILAILCPIAILAFYNVVGGWTIDYIYKAVTFTFTTSTQEELGGLFTNSISSVFEPIFFMSLFVILTGLVVVFGVKNGIEKYSKIMMPLLVVMIVLIAIWSLSLPNSGAGVEFLLKPDFSKITTKTVIDALGQAFFSLSVGAGTIITYASYVKKGDNIVKTSSMIVLFDVFFALLAGLAIMPAVFSFGISPSEGPGLVFITLPYIFSQMPFGSVIAIIFFIILFLAAITSSISLFEVVVAYLVEEFKLSRVFSVICSIFLFIALGVLCSLSQGVWADIKWFGLCIFDFFDSLSANILMPLGGLVAALFVGWKLKRAVIVDELTSSGAVKINKALLEFLIFAIKYLAPITAIAIMIKAILS